MCRALTTDEVLFFNTAPDMLPVYEALLRHVQARHPVTTVVRKTQITLRNRHAFAMVSLPWRRVKGWPEEYLLVSFGLSYRKDSPRIVSSVQPYPNRWTHHVIITEVAQLDEELLAWLEEAYEFAMGK